MNQNKTFSIFLFLLGIFLLSSCGKTELQKKGYNVSYEITFDKGIDVEYIQFTNEDGNITTIRTPDSGLRRTLSIPAGRNVIGLIKGTVKAGQTGNARVKIDAKNAETQINRDKPFSMPSDSNFVFTLSDTVNL